MEAASTGKAARLRAAVETVKGEIAHLKNEHVWVKVLASFNNVTYFLVVNVLIAYAILNHYVMGY